MCVRKTDKAIDSPNSFLMISLYRIKRVLITTALEHKLLLPKWLHCKMYAVKSLSSFIYQLLIIISKVDLLVKNQLNCPEVI